MTDINVEDVLDVVELFSTVLQDIIDTFSIAREGHRELVRLFNACSMNTEFISGYHPFHFSTHFQWLTLYFDIYYRQRGLPSWRHLEEPPSQEVTRSYPSL